MNKDFTQIENKKLAGFWRRFLAYTLDYVFVSIPIYIAIILSIVIFGYNTYGNIIYSILLIALFFIIYYILLAYTRVYLQVKTGQSWGKKFIGLYILSDNDTKMSWGQAIGRIFMYIPASYTLFIAWIMMVFRKDKKTLSDIVVGTKVYMLEDAKYKNRIWYSIIILFIDIIAIAFLIFYGVIIVGIIMRETLEVNNRFESVDVWNKSINIQEEANFENFIYSILAINYYSDYNVDKEYEDMYLDKNNNLNEYYNNINKDNNKYIDQNFDMNNRNYNHSREFNDEYKRHNREDMMNR